MMNSKKEMAAVARSMDAKLNFETTLVSTSVKKLMQEIEAKSRDFYQVPREFIRVMPHFNPREKDEAYQAHIEDLAQSMLVNGFYQDKPLAGYAAEEKGEKVIYLTDGHCRLDAADLANSRGASIATFPMVIKPASTSLEDLTVALVRSNTGKPLTPYETGVVCKRLEGFGWETDTIAERLGYTETYVSQLLALMGAPIEIRRMVQAGKLSAENALKILSKYGSEAVAVLSTAEKNAERSGKTRITAAHLPGAAFQKLVKKQAPVMVNTLRDVKADPAYASLSPSLREKLDAMLETLRAAETEGTVEADAE
ncbi:ParB/RepB/Spo0J family partition protein [Burkholderia multivorans]|uniref:ParB/RepB/Spo0J family partition protein n=2 Tax=Burkholderia multivorans TaxID=87883 RepID=UPI00158D7962|nr:ParB/RepB/Spo0J family partition protein [Burkholderia multivorans]